MRKRLLEQIPEFKKKINTFYKENKREFPWRNTSDPYKIVVSEIMLQQTQTVRVVEKYAAFLKSFPTVSHLAKASQSEVLGLWQGLGYNRRALYLKRTAEIVCEKYGGTFPRLKSQLISLPGIGPNTAGAVIAFAYNKPVVFIETNIRRVFIHEFFREKESIDDKEIYPLIDATLPAPREEQNRSTKSGSEFTSEGSSRNTEGVSEDVRDWYYALMDYYGAYLGKIEQNPNRKSLSYSKQSKFEGSQRQVRGKLLKLLLIKERTLSSLDKEFVNKDHLKNAVEQLVKEGFISKKEGKLYLKP